jgi:hypothetical protein
LVLGVAPGSTPGAFGSAEGERSAAAAGNGPGLKVVVGLNTQAASTGWMLAFPNNYKGSSDPQALSDLQALRQARMLVSLSGPVAQGGYKFASPDTVATNVIFYNLDAPMSPAQRDALSAIDNLAEKLRREQIERSVSTENVARDLREGVIVEVGAGPAATSGSEGIRLPQICPTAAGGLSCAAPARK